jgi:hypothetical protein
MLGLITLAALGAAAPFLAKMASQLTAERIKEWQALSGFDQKKAYLKKAIPKDSAIQDMLKNRDQAERIIAWLDHFIASGAAKTASEGAGVVVGETFGATASVAGPANMKALVRANPNTAAIAQSLLAAMPVAYNPMWSTDKKLKCLKRAATPGSVASQVLDSDEHAKTLIDFIDSSGMVGQKATRKLAKTNSEFKEYLDEVDVTEEAYTRRKTTGNAFRNSVSSYRTVCPYTKKVIDIGTRVAQPWTVKGVEYNNAPWGHFSIQTMEPDALAEVMASLGVKQKMAIDAALKPPTAVTGGKKSKNRDDREKKPVRFRPLSIDNTPVRDNPAELPSGYTIVKKPNESFEDKLEFHVMLNGKPIGKYAMTEEKAVFFANQHASGYVNPFSKEGRARAKAEKE